MRLPAELRNTTYHLVLTRDSTIVVCTPGRLKSIGFEFHKAWPMRKCRRYTELPGHSLLRVSRQIRQETLPVHYLNNVFEFRITPADVDKLCEWYNSVSKHTSGASLDFGISIKPTD